MADDDAALAADILARRDADNAKIRAERDALRAELEARRQYDLGIRFIARWFTESTHRESLVPVCFEWSRDILEAPFWGEQ